jgi:predicted transcriptional regulator YheO
MLLLCINLDKSPFEKLKISLFSSSSSPSPTPSSSPSSSSSSSVDYVMTLHQHRGYRVELFDDK